MRRAGAAMPPPRLRAPRMLPALPAAMAVAATGRLAEEAAAMAGAVRGALGPRGGRALVLRPDGRPLLTRDGRRLLEALCLQPPTARYRGGTGKGGGEAAGAGGGR